MVILLCDVYVLDLYSFYWCMYCKNIHDAVMWYISLQLEVYEKSIIIVTAETPYRSLQR